MEVTGAVTAVMHDTTDLDGTVGFWRDLLDLEEVYRDDRYVYLGKLSEHGPFLAFQKVAELKTGKNRLHLDVRAPDRATFVARIIAMGGTHVRDHQEAHFPMWSVMTDPEGNEFCVYEPEREDT